MSNESAALYVLVAIATLPLAMLTWMALEQIWDRATYAVYLWRHRRKLKF